MRLVADNDTGGPGVARLRDVNVEANQIVDNGSRGVLVVGGFDSATDAVVRNARIVLNDVLRNGSAGVEILGGTVGGDRNQVIRSVVRENRIEENSTGIVLLGGQAFVGGLSASNENQIEVFVVANEIRDNLNDGIRGSANERAGSANDATLRVSGNLVESNGVHGIAVNGGRASGMGTSDDNTVLAAVKGNTVLDHPNGTGIAIEGGSASGASSADRNTIDARLRGNEVSGASIGIGLVAGGTESASDNGILASVEENVACGNAVSDIFLQGGLQGFAPVPDNTGAGNTITGGVKRNEVGAVPNDVDVSNGTAGNLVVVNVKLNTPCPP